MAKQTITFHKFTEIGLFQTTQKLIHDQLVRTEKLITL